MRFERFVSARVDRFSLTHRPSVARPRKRVRENCIPFEDNFLNGCSGVRKITERHQPRFSRHDPCVDNHFAGWVEPFAKPITFCKNCD
jgi:hypothetical protein